MTTVLTNNRKLLVKRDTFKGLCGFEAKKTEYNLPKATPKLLREIKKRILEERQSRNKKIIIVYVFVLVTCVSLLLYLL